MASSTISNRKFVIIMFVTSVIMAIITVISFNLGR